MPRSCTICTNTRRAEIESELVAGQPLRGIAAQHRVSASALFRHHHSCVPQELALARQHQDTLSAETLLGEMAELKNKLRAGLEQAEQAGNAPAFVAFARELRQSLEAYFGMASAIAALAARDRGTEEVERLTIPLPSFDEDTTESCELMRHGRTG